MQSTALYGLLQGKLTKSQPDSVQKTKAEMELNLARDAKNNKKGFYRYIGQKRMTKECVLPLIYEKGELVTDMEKAEIHNNFFASLFTAGMASHTSSVPEAGAGRANSQ